MAKDVTMYRGDSRSLIATVTKLDAATNAFVPYNVTGHTVRWTLKTSKEDLDSAALVQKISGSGITIKDAEGGKLAIDIDAADTDSLETNIAYVWDVQLTDSAGRVYTVEEGTLTTRRDVTREFAYIA